MDSISEARLSFVNPSLAAKIKQMADMVYNEGIQFRVTQGYRTYADQAAIYSQGRTTSGKIVTNAPPGHSWHEFGLAVDVAPDDPSLPGYQPDWNESHPAWTRLVAVGISLGMLNGKSFKDEPHFQLTGRFPVSPNDEVRRLFEHGGVQAVWDAAEITG